MCDGCLEAHVKRLLADDIETHSRVKSWFGPHRYGPKPLPWHRNTGALQQRWCTGATTGDSFLPSASLSKTESNTITVYIYSMLSQIFHWVTFKQLKKTFLLLLHLGFVYSCVKECVFHEFIWGIIACVVFITVNSTKLHQWNYSTSSHIHTRSTHARTRAHTWFLKPSVICSLQRIKQAFRGESFPIHYPRIYSETSFTGYRLPR